MAFQRMVCVDAARRHRPGGPTSSNRSGNTPALLLAPLDSAAAHVLSSQLTAASVGFQTYGPVIAVPFAYGEESILLQRIQSSISMALQHRVKGVFSDKPVDAEGLVLRLLHAELLPELFDRTEVEWIRGVLAQERIFSIYHPILNAADGSVFGHEALIRARSADDDDLIGAGQLVYAARKLNLQHEFDQSARLSAIRGAARAGLTGTKLFINFMPNAIYDPDVCLRTTVEEAERSGIGMQSIVFEVVETEQIESLDRLRQIVAFVRGLGAEVALDDLSSGYASLQFLADLMPDYVKIDRDLITMAAASSSARHTLESIVSLARKLEVKVIAEGVETEGQLRICLDAGVDYLQGYLFALPGSPPCSVTAPAMLRQAA